MGLGEILIILALALILFGPDDLPDIARKLGKIVYQIRKATSEFSREFKDTMEIPGNVINKALEQPASTSSRSSEQKAKTAQNENNEEESTQESIKKDEALDEVLLKYEDEESDQGESSVENKSSHDPLNELPPDMVSYEEKDASR